MIALKKVKVPEVPVFSISLLYQHYSLTTAYLHSILSSYSEAKEIQETHYPSQKALEDSPEKM